MQVLGAVADLDRPQEKRPAIPEGVRPDIEVNTYVLCVCVYVYTYVYMYGYVCMYVCMYNVWTHTLRGVFVLAMQARVAVLQHAKDPATIHACIHTYMHMHTHTCTCILTYPRVCMLLRPGSICLSDIVASVHIHAYMHTYIHASGHDEELLGERPRESAAFH